MNLFPENVSRNLSNSIYQRMDKNCVSQNLQYLDVEVNKNFKQFYETYEGPFSSNFLGFELLDLCNQETNIRSQTEVCRDIHRFPKRFLVLTELLGGEILVYDSETDFVFQVDFEGSDAEFLEGRLEPRWKSFYDFLNDFFR